MAKDPAFLFYPNDWIGGTMGMSFEEKGAYMELLMMQFNRGHMTKDMIAQTLGHKFGQLWGQLEVKFSIDSNGLYFNSRLEEEKIKRKKFVSSRNNNRKGTNQYSKKDKNNIGHMTNHMENENENVISNNYKVENFLKDWNEIRKELTNKPSFLNTIGPMEQKEKFTELSKAYGREHFINALKGLFKQERFPKGMSAMNSSPKHFLGHFETYLTAYGDQNKNVWGNED